MHEASDESHGGRELNELAVCRPLGMLVPPPRVRPTESECPTQLEVSNPSSSNAPVLVCILRLEVVAFDPPLVPHSLRFSSVTMHLEGEPFSKVGVYWPERRVGHVLTPGQVPHDEGRGSLNSSSRSARESVSLVG
jgi:hypothetical protein